MLNAQEVNTILDSLLNTLEERVPTLRTLSIGNPELMKSAGTHGSIVLGALFTGSLDGKVTLVLEWTTGFQIAEEAGGLKVDSFSEEAQRAIESVFYEAAQKMASGFMEQGAGVEIFPLPTLLDTSVLLGEEGETGALRLPINAPSGNMNLYLAFK